MFSKKQHIYKKKLQKVKTNTLKYIAIFEKIRYNAIRKKCICLLA